MTVSKQKTICTAVKVSPELHETEIKVDII